MIDRSPGARPASTMTDRIPSRTARSGASGVVSVLALYRLSPTSRATSVKVPPISTPSRDSAFLAATLYPISIGRGRRVLGCRPLSQSLQFKRLQGDGKPMVLLKCRRLGSERQPFSGGGQQ